jgi:TPP-dependent pyruvate/acetoin dehydrogenase alpha subunit
MANGKGMNKIKLFRDKAIRNKLFSEIELNNIENDTVRQVEDAFEFARSSQLPDLSDIMTDIYADKY